MILLSQRIGIMKKYTRGLQVRPSTATSYFILGTGVVYSASTLMADEAQKKK
jgi:hypothetical protein